MNCDEKMCVEFFELVVGGGEKLREEEVHKNYYKCSVYPWGPDVRGVKSYYTCFGGSHGSR